MMLSTSHYQHDFTPEIQSHPPHLDGDGDMTEATVSIFPFGMYNETQAHMILNLDEADQFVRFLWKIVSDAQNGKYTGPE
jgi:hypothetical protein